MSNVLLLDTGFSAIPIYEYLCAKGHKVFVMGNRPEDSLAKRAGKNWMCQDYSVVEDVLKAVQSYGIEFLVPGCTDVSIATCVQVTGSKTVFDSPQINSLMADKQKFRALCEQLSIPAPKTIALDDFPRPGTYICKPTDAFSGRGITVFDGDNLNDKEQAVQLGKESSPEHQVLIEEYIDGQLYSYSAFLESHSVVAFVVVKEGSSANQFRVDTSYVDTQFPQSSLVQLRDVVERMSSHLDLVDGLIHLQFILQESDETPFAIEVTRRCPGDLYAMLVRFSTGLDYAGKYASYFVEVDAFDSQGEHNFTLRNTITSDADSILGLMNFDKLGSLHAYIPLLSEGDQLIGNQTRVGVSFSDYPSLEDLEAAYQRGLQRNLTAL